MGRGYIVEDAVEGYLSELCQQQAGPVTGLLIGQVSSSLCIRLMCNVSSSLIVYTLVTI